MKNSLKQKIGLGIAGISLIIGSYFSGKALYERGYQAGNIDGKSTAIYQTIKDLDEMGLLGTSRRNAEASMRGTGIYFSLLKNSGFKANPQDKDLVELVDEIK